MYKSLKTPKNKGFRETYYIKWGFESRLKRYALDITRHSHYIKWGFESRLKQSI